MASPRVHSSYENYEWETGSQEWNTTKLWIYFALTQILLLVPVVFNGAIGWTECLELSFYHPAMSWPCIHSSKIRLQGIRHHCFRRLPPLHLLFFTSSDSPHHLPPPQPFVHSHATRVLLPYSSSSPLFLNLLLVFSLGCLLYPHLHPLPDASTHIPSWDPQGREKHGSCHSDSESLHLKTRVPDFISVAVMGYWPKSTGAGKDSFGLKTSTVPQRQNPGDRNGSRTHFLSVHTFVFHSPVDGYRGCVLFLDIANKTAMNMSNMESFQDIPRSVVAG